MGATLDDRADPRPLGRVVAEASDEALAVRTRPPVADRLASIHAAQERRAAAVTGLMPAAAAGSRSGGRARGRGKAAVLLWPRAEALRVVVGDPSAADRDGLAWIAAPPGAQVPIGFSDGTRIVLASGGRARVASVTDHGARIVLERGSVRADVVPRRGSDWAVVGGPFEIHVTGTSFDARWDPDREELSVTMHHGSVIVRGPCLAAERALAGDEAATLSCIPVIPATGARPPIPPPPLPLVAPPSPAAAPSAEATTRAPAVAPSPASTANATGPTPHAPAPRSWRDLANAGAYKEALAAAEAEGFDGLCGGLPAGDLMELAAAARLGG